MSTILRPAGSQPARVYWIRRLVVLGALFLVVVLLWSMLARGGGGGAEDEPDAGDAEPASDSDETTADDETTAANGRTCAAADLTLAVAADAQTYAAGVQPVFTVTITNTSTSSCAVDAGDAARELLVTSGTDRVWSSLDCAGDAAERLLLLPAETADSVAVTWPRIRSAEGCTAGLPEPRPGTYHVVAKLLGAESADTVFTLG
jgi:hypothetical protein